MKKSLAVAVLLVMAQQASAELINESSATFVTQQDEQVAGLTTQQSLDVKAQAIMSDQDSGLFFECAGLSDDKMRLACFDALAQGKTPNMLTSKRSIELSSTIVNTFKGNPQIVYANDDLVAHNLDDSKDNQEGGDHLKLASWRYTPLSQAFDLDKNNTNLWSARPHNQMYILPLYFNARANRHPSTPTQDQHDYSHGQMRVPELKFQISLKTKAAENLLGTDADLWFGYTQQSHWQVYNEDNSRPFRAHDYQPEVFITHPVKADLPFDGRLRMLGAGLVHHSNGEKDPLSRSWNRAYLMAGMEWDRLTVMPRLWGRIAVGEDKGKQNDNPDIIDYYGYGDVKFLYRLNKDANLSGTVRYNPFSNKGALQLDYVHSIGRGIGAYVQLFHGYGQSIVDYNHESTGIGMGVMLNDWMGL